MPHLIFEWDFIQCNAMQLVFINFIIFHLNGFPTRCHKYWKEMLNKCIKSQVHKKWKFMRSTTINKCIEHVSTTFFLSLSLSLWLCFAHLTWLYLVSWSLIVLNAKCLSVKKARDVTCKLLSFQPAYRLTVHTFDRVLDSNRQLKRKIFVFFFFFSHS